LPFNPFVTFVSFVPVVVVVVVVGPEDVVVAVRVRAVLVVRAGDPQGEDSG
jgi:hypothetical protein